MKKFQFPLEKVLSYKQQQQDTLQAEHAAALARVREQEARVDALWAQYQAYSEEYNQRCAAGLLITEVLAYQSGLRTLEREIQRETGRLKELQDLAEAKRREVVDARRETSSIEKLKEKRLQSYQKAVSKSEELYIEEFVSSSRVKMVAQQ